MNRLLYRITGWKIIIAGILWAILNIYSSLGALNILDWFYEVGFGTLFSLIIFVLTFFPGRFIIRISDEKKKHNIYTNTSVILILIGIVLVFITAIIMVSVCPLPGLCDSAGWMIVLGYGVFPALILYVIGLILLMINNFRSR